VEYTTITTSAYCYNTFPKLLQARLSPVKEDFWELLERLLTDQRSTQSCHPVSKFNCSLTDHTC